MKIKEFNTINDSAEKLAEHTYKLYLKKSKSIFTIVLSGGNSPIPFFRILAEKYAQKFNWNNIYFFFADERFISNQSELNNFKSAKTELFDKVKNINASNIFPVNTALNSPEEAAEDYENTIRNFFLKMGLLNSEKDIPVFDLTLLGIGPDGHTASIFPGYKEMNEKYKLVSATDISPTNPKLHRITMTLPLINNSASIAFLTSLKDKEELINKILNKNAAEIPAASVKSLNNLIWFISKD